MKYNLLLNDVKYTEFKNNYLALYSDIDNNFVEFKESYLIENQKNFESFKIKKENEKKVKIKNLEDKILTLFLCLML